MRAERAFLRRWRRSKRALAGGAMVGVLVLAALLAPLLAPYDPLAQDLKASLSPPSPAHPLGTDILGRDILSRLLFGARISVGIGFLSQLIALGIAVPVGVASGLRGGRADEILMRFVDVMYAFPDLLLVILFRFIFGGGFHLLCLSLGLAGWCTLARLVRAEALSVRSREFVQAAILAGARGGYLVFRHILPNILGPVIVTLVFAVPRAIFAEAALSFIGAGINPPTPSWGVMIRYGYESIFASPYPVIFPTLALSFALLSFLLLGEGLRDILDPRARAPSVFEVFAGRRISIARGAALR